MNTALHNDTFFSHQSFQLTQSFYDQVSNIIKIFRKQLTLFIKLSQSFIEESELVGQMVRKKEESLQAVKEYLNVVVDDSLLAIMQRFVARIKQILQLTNNIAPGFLQWVGNGVKKVQIMVHKNIGVITVFQIFSDILNILPSYFTAKSFSPQKAKPKKKQQNKQNLPIQKKSTTLDLILEGFKKSCNNLSALNIDEGQFRALFFSARQDRHRETSQLQNDMKYRNRFIREQMIKYDSGYESYREKLKREKENINKRQLSKLKRMMSLNEKMPSNKKVQNEQNNQHNTSMNLKQIKEQKKSYSPDFLLMQGQNQKSNLLTTYNFTEPPPIKQSTIYSNLYPHKQKSQHKQRFTKINQRQTNEKARQEQFQDFINEIKVKGEFRMTKVLFGNDGKLELSPYTDVKSSSNTHQNPTTAAIKNKIIFRKAQENIRKKLNRFTTEPSPFNSSNPNNKSASIPQNSPPGTDKKTYVSSQPPEALKVTMNSKKMRKFTWKDKEIKFMGIKGMNSVKINSAIENH